MDLAALQKAAGYTHLALLFKISASRMARALYGPGARYATFTIAKRSGGVRTIESPFGVTREMQRKLAPMLTSAYQPNARAHGFISGRSVVSNSSVHVGRSLVVNFDLQDFFHSITFNRVRGLFLKNPFGLNWQVATILAQACCAHGRLPAGGITSPVISNLILARFDKRMASLAARHGGEYTRYADDITISFDRPLHQVTGIASRDGDGNAQVGPQVLQVIQSEGFAVNPGKTRIQGGGARKVVAGLVVNKKRNVRRDWLRKLDATIHAMRTHGCTSVAVRLMPDLDPNVATRLLLRKVHGRLAYLYMVRGRGDWVVAELAREFNFAHDDARLRVPDTEFLSQPHRLARSSLVVTCSSGAGSSLGSWNEQGTGFVVSSGLIVTADHVVRDDSGKLYPYIFVHQERSFTARHECKLLHADAHRDIAILELKVGVSDLIRTRSLLGTDPDVGWKVASVGFPSYSLGHQASKQEHEVTLVRTTSGVKKLVVTGNIHGGLSGGPVYDAECRVVGIVHRGTAGGGHANEVVAVGEIEVVLAAL